MAMVEGGGVETAWERGEFGLILREKFDFLLPLPPR